MAKEEQAQTQDKARLDLETQELSETTKAPSKFKKIFSFLSPVYDVIESGIQDAPLISRINDKLSHKQKKIAFGVTGVVFLVLLVLLLIFLFKPKSQDQSQEVDAIVSIQQSGEDSGGGDGEDDLESSVVKLPEIPALSLKSPVIDDDRLANLIKKADILYKSGDKEEALNILKSIANFSKSIANYNLGVISFKSNDLNKSLLYYDKAIMSGEDISISALNAASTAYLMNETGKFRYYANISNAYINQLERNWPYSYVYALNSYYQGHYFEALSPLIHPNSDFFEKERKRLLSKIYTLFNNNKQAFDALKTIANSEDDLALGQLLARDGRLDEAKAYIQRYMNKYPNSLRALITMELISLKSGDFRTASSLLDEFSALKQQNTNIKNPYPIKVRISPLVLNREYAQKYFWDYTFVRSSTISDEILFYYAPFKVLNIQQALNILSDGILDSKISPSNLQESSSLIIKGATISDININIVESLRLVAHNDLRGALDKIQKYLDENPSYSVLYYNAGLLYAQLGNYQMAHKYFLRAYHLDTTDLLSGVFALLSGKMIFKDISTLNENVSQSILDSQYNEEDLKFYINLKQWVNNPGNAYFVAKKDARAVEHALQAVVSFKLGKLPEVAVALRNLKMQKPNDIVTDIFVNLAKNFGKDMKYTALNLQYLFQDKERNLDEVFYGPALARDMYSYVGFITGNIKNQKQILNYKLSTQTGNPNGILQTLALLNFYDSNFETSYSLYNQLINQLGEDDINTRFGGALSAIGAGHRNTANLLLQLSKLDTPTSYESKFALGLLYQEVGNYNAAAQLFNSISNYPFKSRFLDFIVDESKIDLPK